MSERSLLSPRTQRPPGSTPQERLELSSPPSPTLTQGQQVQRYAQHIMTVRALDVFAAEVDLLIAATAAEVALPG